MAKKEIMIIADYTSDTPVSLEEICEICNISADFIQDLIEYEIVHPEGELPEEWQFDLDELQRIKTALRLQRDLEVNLAGVAVVLDLLDEMERLRARMAMLEKLYLK
ncbi:chaperone modulator CbpM [Aquicella lusitana]|uniref:MerR family transcriptional regulator n=1 Tax=Aquicella lusitana TaxID=254246 RepID=A0A370GDB0_9COXI|nr:chaperone modulator CbpM [Aquicella lusitana]RDI41812.1 MerR family transcriptional regulator [Aquicella lusitana]VVC73720.1 Chaperone modulatory protein CbpM [Aquicella lusitana]